MIIALFTDFGVRDAYVAQMKGVILGINADVTVIDLNHEVAAFDVRQAAHLLEASSRYLCRPGTIVVAVVDPGVGTARRPLLCGTQSDRWFVGPDNGVLTHVLAEQGFREAYVLTEAAYFCAARCVDFPWARHIWPGGSASCQRGAGESFWAAGGKADHISLSARHGLLVRLRWAKSSISTISATSSPTSPRICWEGCRSASISW